MKVGSLKSQFTLIFYFYYFAKYVLLYCCHWPIHNVLKRKKNREITQNVNFIQTAVTFFDKLPLFFADFERFSPPFSELPRVIKKVIMAARLLFHYLHDQSKNNVLIN